jgi:hypothetical protein
MRLQRFRQFINEALDLSKYITEPGKKKVNIFIGRLQPPHKIHCKRIIDGDITEVFLVKASAKNADKSPFPFEIQKEMLSEIFGSKVTVHQVSGAFIGEITNILREEGKEPVKFFCGDDREATYKAMLNRYEDELNLNITVVAFERSGDDSVSGTAIRKALKTDDFESFKTTMSKEVATEKWFKKLQKYIQ